MLGGLCQVLETDNEPQDTTVPNTETLEKAQADQNGVPNGAAKATTGWKTLTNAVSKHGKTIASCAALSLFTGYLMFGKNKRVRRRRLKPLELQRRALAAVAHMEAQDVNAMSPAERVMHRRNLADANSMAAKDVHAMSPSELITHRRRLTYGPRVNLVMAELMDECLDAKKRHDGR